MKKIIKQTKKTLDRFNPDMVYKLFAMGFIFQCIFAEGAITKIFGIVVLGLVFYYDNHE